MYTVLLGVREIAEIIISKVSFLKQYENKISNAMRA